MSASMENCNDSTNTKDHSNSIIVGLPPLPREEDEIEEAVFQKAEEACLAWIDEAAADESDIVSPSANTQPCLKLDDASIQKKWQTQFHRNCKTTDSLHPVR